MTLHGPAHAGYEPASGVDGPIPLTTTEQYQTLTATLEATQGQIDGLCGQHPNKCHQNQVACVGDGLKICPWVTSRVGQRLILSGGCCRGVLGSRGFGGLGKVFTMGGNRISTLLLG